MSPGPGADATVYRYFAEQDGEVLLVTEDDSFVKHLRTVLHKALNIQNARFTHLTGFEPALKHLLKQVRERVPVVVLVERMVRLRPSTEFITAIKGAMPTVRVLLLTFEAEADMSAYLHEAGADSILTKPASANDIIEKLAFLVKPPMRVRKLMGEARRLLSQERCQEVLELTEKVLALKPGSASALMLAGEASLCRGEREEAVALFEQAHESAPLFLEPLRHLAEVYHGMDEEKRLYYMKKLDEISPLNVRRKYDIGRLLIQLDRREEAEAYFDKALERAMQESFSIIGNVAMDIVDALPEQDADLAEKYLNRFLEFKSGNLGHEDIVIFNRRGMMLRRQGKWQEAAENYQLALQVVPGDEGLHYNLGLAWLDGERHGKAAACFDKALKLNPGLAEGRLNVALNLAMGYQKAGKPLRAEIFLRKAVEMDPSDDKAREALARLSREIGEASS